MNGSSNNSNGGGRRYPRTVALAELIDLLVSVNTRLQPFLSQYHELVRDDPVLENSVCINIHCYMFEKSIIVAFHYMLIFLLF